MTMMTTTSRVCPFSWTAATTTSHRRVVPDATTTTSFRLDVSYHLDRHRRRLRWHHRSHPPPFHDDDDYRLPPPLIPMKMKTAMTAFCLCFYDYDSQSSFWPILGGLVVRRQTVLGEQ